MAFTIPKIARKSTNTRYLKGPMHRNLLQMDVDSILDATESEETNHRNGDGEEKGMGLSWRAKYGIIEIKPP
jgi:hypothetical protein